MNAEASDPNFEVVCYDQCGWGPRRVVKWSLAVVLMQQHNHYWCHATAIWPLNTERT